MRSIMLVIALSLILCSETKVKATANEKYLLMPQTTDSIPHRYAIKSAVITYEVENNGIKSSVATCFDDFGNKESIESKSFIKSGSHFDQVHTLEIYKSDTVYLLNLEERTGVQKNGNRRRNDAPDFNALTTQAMKSLGIMRNEPEEYLGKMCDVYVMHNSGANIHAKYLVWNNIVLQSEINADGNITKIHALSIRDNVSVPPKNFEVPLDIIPDEDN